MGNVRRPRVVAMHIDLNADLGEGCGDDAAMLEVVTSASIACGGHTGDRASMHTACDAARRRKVRIGAHPSYEDREHFGRHVTDVASDEVRRLVVRQMRALAAEAVRVGSRIAYVKPHGALYHAVAEDAVTAGAFVHAVAQFAPGLPVLGAPESHVLRLAADAGLRPVAEGFADRSYLPNGRLAPRSMAGAVLHDEAEVARRAVLIATEGVVFAVDGSPIPLIVDSICLHGDTPGAATIARSVRTALDAAGVEVRAFA